MLDLLVSALMTWSALAADLPVPDSAPAIERATAEEMWQAVHPERPYSADTGFGPLAYYDHTTATVYLRHDWNPDSLRDLSILVHELVHHAQFAAGVEYSCFGELERAAYDVQRRFLEPAGADFYETVEINEMFLFFVTRCSTGD